MKKKILSRIKHLPSTLCGLALIAAAIYSVVELSVPWEAATPVILLGLGLIRHKPKVKPAAPEFGNLPRYMDERGNYLNGKGKSE